MPEGLHTVVMPDHYEVGSAIAGELLKDYEGRTEGLTVGILCGNQEQLSMQKRLSGFLDAVEGTLCWCQSTKIREATFACGNKRSTNHMFHGSCSRNWSKRV